MASEKLFEGIPAFPDDVLTASIAVVGLADLASGDNTTTKRLFEACQEVGFFLLDLRRHHLGETLIREIDELFGVMEEVMNLPSEEKEKYLNDLPKSFLGFKPRGQARTETNEPDRFEWFNLAQDGLLGITPLQPLPASVLSRQELFASFLRHGQTVVSLICEHLARQIGLPPSAFTSRQPLDKASGTVVRFIKAEASPTDTDLRTSMVHHTDFGTVTLLANVLGGLQILAPGKAPKDSDAWLWVRPSPGCLIVNLGDAMVQWTGGLLRSNVHRVRFGPGDQRFVNRYSMALLVRPEKNASMKAFVGGDAPSENSEDLTAWEWERKRVMALTKGEEVTKSKGGKTVG